MNIYYAKAIDHPRSLIIAARSFREAYDLFIRHYSAVDIDKVIIHRMPIPGRTPHVFRWCGGNWADGQVAHRTFKYGRDK